jgi:hypothetical protein
VGVFASRKIAWACARHRAFLALVGQERPDLRTRSDCRKRPLEALRDVWGQGRRLAGEAGGVPWGNVSPDGPPIQGHAWRHQARRDGDRKKEGERGREAMEALVPRAYPQAEAEAAAWGRRRGDARPAALARREDRVGQREAAMRRWEAQAQAAADAARQRRAEADAERPRTGKPRRGTAPHPVMDTPDDKAPSHVTDPERPRRRTHPKGWEDCDHVPASVAGAYQIMVACDVPKAAQDTQQAAPVAQATLAHLAPAGRERPKDASGPPPRHPGDLGAWLFQGGGGGGARARRGRPRHRPRAPAASWASGRSP